MRRWILSNLDRTVKNKKLDLQNNSNNLFGALEEENFPLANSTCLT